MKTSSKDIKSKYHCELCKRELTTDKNALFYFCCNCKRLHGSKGREDYYERRDQ